jgi:hypothetical protein
MTRDLWATCVRGCAFGLAALTAIASGCAGPAPSDQPDSPAFSASPAVRGAESGVELRWWVLPDDGDVIARALSGYESRPLPIDPPVRQLWRANGLRLVAVPVADLPALQARFQSLRSEVLVADLRAAGIVESDLTRVAATMAPTASASQEQWLGEVPRWTDAVRGPTTSRRTVIKMDSGLLPLGPGRLRLLLRAWAVPMQIGAERAAAGLRLELAPQFEETRNRLEDPELALSPPLAVEDQGLVLSRLVMGMTLDGGDALVIVPDRPGTDWAAIAEGGPAVPAPEADIFGPPAPEGVTLGEAMLSSEGIGPLGGASARAPRPVKAVIVLIPRVPDRFALVGE